MLRPIYPQDGVEYVKAMAEATAEYEAWVNGRRGKQTIQMFTTKKNPVTNEEFPDE